MGIHHHLAVIMMFITVGTLRELTYAKKGIPHSLVYIAVIFHTTSHQDRYSVWDYTTMQVNIIIQFFYIPARFLNVHKVLLHKKTNSTFEAVYILNIAPKLC